MPTPGPERKRALVSVAVEAPSTGVDCDRPKNETVRKKLWSDKGLHGNGASHCLGDSASCQGSALAVRDMGVLRNADGAVSGPGPSAASDQSEAAVKLTAGLRPVRGGQSN